MALLDELAAAVAAKGSLDLRCSRLRRHGLLPPLPSGLRRRRALAARALLLLPLLALLQALLVCGRPWEAAQRSHVGAGQPVCVLLRVVFLVAALQAMAAAPCAACAHDVLLAPA